MGLLPDGLLDIMQCPQCAGELNERLEPPSLICGQCRLAYPIDKGGIPVMLEEAATPLED